MTTNVNFTNLFEYFVCTCPIKVVKLYTRINKLQVLSSFYKLAFI
ncbi:hypothetical protein PIL02S_01323 [Paenibacillus illinoisensis]|uniref:Uncharacterized protein n=1 Tax=Paenibacillus illinoisensis TaxID=59845 RepID=A0A2W0CRV1_9BACL|nr:hypothetical protein PIL02S_01323 [Paenibacillus illinoisensis]